MDQTGKCYNHLASSHVSAELAIDARVAPGDQEIHAEVEKAEDGQEPEEVIEMAAVKISRDPSELPVPRRNGSHDRDEQGAQVVAKRHRGEREGGTHAPHRVGCLVVEELQLPDEGEDFRDAHDEVLRHLPEYGYGNVGIAVVVQVVPRRGSQPHHLQSTGCQHGEDGDDEADAHARQLREAALPAGPPSDRRHDDAIVDRDPHDHADGVGHGERRR
ncbi:hypothetical protein MUK42_33519, partial [Musa troglodytarum]